MSVCNILFADVLVFRFGVFWGMCDVNSCNAFLLIFMALWVPISATLFRRAVLVLFNGDERKWDKILQVLKIYHSFRGSKIRMVGGGANATRKAELPATEATDGEWRVHDGWLVGELATTIWRLREARA
jgi:hypothetical protein